MREPAPHRESTTPPADGLVARLALMAAFTVGVFGALALRRQVLRLELDLGVPEGHVAWAAIGLTLGALAGLWSTAGLAARVERPLFALGVATVGAAVGLFAWTPLSQLLGAPGGPLGRALATAVGVAVPAGTLALGLPFAAVSLWRATPSPGGALERVAGALLAGAGAGLVLLGGLLGALSASALAVLAAQRVCLIVGLVAVIRGLRAPKPTVRVADAATLDARTRRLALGLIGITGATAVALVLGWVRLATLVMGAAPTARAMVLAPLLLGAAAGFAWSARRAEASPVFAFARRQLGLLAVGGVLLVLLPRFPWLMLSLGRMVRHTPPAWLPWQLIRLVIGGATVGPLAFGVAASLSSAVPLLGAQVAPARTLALAGGAAGLGAIALAALAMGLPVLAGSGPAVFAATVLLTALGAMVALTVRVEVPWSKNRRQAFLGAAGLAGLWVSAWLAVDPQLGARDVAVAGRAPEWPLRIGSFQRFEKTLAERGAIVFRKDDPDATATVEEQGGRRTLRVNGRIEATARETVELERLAAHLGALVGEAPPRSALVLGPRSGAAVEALLAYPLERLEVVGASKSELEAARAFAPEHAVAFADPRVVLTVDGLTAAVRRQPKPVELIVGSVTPSAASELFTAEFVTTAKAGLVPGGRLVLRLDVGDWPEAMVRGAIRTARSAFDFGTTFGSDDEVFLVLSNRRLDLSPESLAPRLEEPKVARALARLGVRSPLTLLSHQLQTDAAQKVFGGDGRLNGRDDDLVGFGADVASFAPADWKFPDERHAFPKASTLAIAEAVARTPLDAEQARELHGSLARVNGVRDPLVRAAAEVWLSLEPASEPASVAVAKSALAQGSPSAAKVVLEPLVLGGSKNPELVAQWLETERALLRRESAPWNPLRVDAALELGKAVLAKTPAHPELAEAVQRLEEVR